MLLFLSIHRFYLSGTASAAKSLKRLAKGLPLHNRRYVLDNKCEQRISFFPTPIHQLDSLFSKIEISGVMHALFIDHATAPQQASGDPPNS